MGLVDHIKRRIYWSLFGSSLSLQGKQTEALAFRGLFKSILLWFGIFSISICFFIKQTRELVNRGNRFRLFTLHSFLQIPGSFFNPEEVCILGVVSSAV